MAKKPAPQKQGPKNPKPIVLSDAEKYIIQSNINRRKELEERNRPKNYQDLMEYAGKTMQDFPQNVSISPYETAAPYYGEEADAQLGAAAEYAAELAHTDGAKASVALDYYNDIKNKIPVIPSDVGSMYFPQRNLMALDSPERDAVTLMTSDEKTLAKNNYGSKQKIIDSLQGQQNIAKGFRDTVEHESFHALDKSVKFYNQDTQDVGYMGRQSHLPTGLAKVQREHYSMTGKRFETPDEFKSFVIDLAKSKDPEEAMSGFTEEAKRSLRAQISNIRSVIPSLDDFKKYEEGGALRLFKGRRPYSGEQKKLDFLETSAQLIPALVEYRQASQQAT